MPSSSTGRPWAPKWCATAFRSAVGVRSVNTAPIALTGEVATDGTHAAATLAYDLRRGDWDRRLIEDLLDVARLEGGKRLPIERAPIENHSPSWDRPSWRLSESAKPGV